MELEVLLGEVNSIKLGSVTLGILVEQCGDKAVLSIGVQ